MNVLLVCNAGMSTGLLKYQMELTSEKKGLHYQFKAVPLSELDTYINWCDFIYLGPQISFVQKDIQESLKNKIKVEVISEEDFGYLNSEKLVENLAKIKPKNKHEKKKLTMKPDKTIMLCCNAGMSTSMMVEKMKSTAKSENKNYKIFATAVSEIDDIISKENLDCILLGPQVRFMVSDLKQKYDNKVPIDSIDSVDYGTMNGEKVLKQAEELMN